MEFLKIAIDKTKKIAYNQNIKVAHNIIYNNRFAGEGKIYYIEKGEYASEHL